MKAELLMKTGALEYPYLYLALCLVIAMVKQ
jgi:hypothetical protein